MAAEIIEEFGDQLESITLMRGGNGRFDVTVDGQLIFSKAALKRHAEPDEVVEKIRRLEAASGRDITKMTS